MPNALNSILLLFAHPSLERSEVNAPMFELAQTLPQVTAVDLYREYPSFKIDIDKEQQRLIEHDIVIMMFPLYWYSVPALLKEWQDLVLEYGFAYGHQGNKLQRKTLLCAITAGGAESAYTADGYNHFTIRQLLSPIEQTASLTGMHYLPPFVLFGSRTAVEENRLQQHLDNWHHLLSALQHGQIDLEMAAHLPQLNQQHLALFKERL
ncbi:NAD(P)H-dependent oxidoreductase [Agarivorans sp. QJM3NY_33]|uniref:NAD(P)H-dependent oxidoreductase n=1 Tax=Agarivorans sp. QJM3NY_33 TaxID=3421432 RepID=UPI003D7C6BF8